MSCVKIKDLYWAKQRTRFEHTPVPCTASVVCQDFCCTLLLYYHMIVLYYYCTTVVYDSVLLIEGDHINQNVPPQRHQQQARERALLQLSTNTIGRTQCDSWHYKAQNLCARLRTAFKHGFCWLVIFHKVGPCDAAPIPKKKTTPNNIFSAHTGAVAKSNRIGGEYKMGSSLSAGSPGRNECNPRL